MKKIIACLIKYLSILIIALVGLSSKWYMNNFGGTKIEEIIFTLRAPLDGMDKGIIISFLHTVLLPMAVILLVSIVLIELFPRINISKNSEKTKVLNLKVDIVLFPLLILYGLNNSIVMYEDINLKEYIENQSNRNTIYENYYTDPKSVDLSFPEDKSNLIHIILESMESTYASKDLGGAYDYNLIPNLSEIARENLSFSTSEKLTGGFITKSTHFTIGSLVAHTSGVPLSVSIYGNSYSGYGQFLPGAYSLGDILEGQDYNQVFAIGSDAKFGGRDDYFTYHGGYEIHDYNYAKEKQLIDKDYEVWWGYEDEKLYSFARDELLELSQSDQPFNYTMLTVDTHHPGGYKCQLCESHYPDQYSNVISCADRQVKDFIDWIREQDFYDDTVIVITGDHNSMDVDYFTDLPEDYRRAPYNAIINPQREYDSSKLRSRDFCTMDWYPTILGAMGIEIQGNRLGLGTNLFSERETLMEELGTDYLMDELYKSSKYYDDNLLFFNE